MRFCHGAVLHGAITLRRATPERNMRRGDFGRNGRGRKAYARGRTIKVGAIPSESACYSFIGGSCDYKIVSLAQFWQEDGRALTIRTRVRAAPPTAPCGRPP